MVDYSHDAHAIVVPVAISCQVSCYGCLQSLQLGKMDGDFSPLVECLVPFHTVKASQLDIYQ